MAPKHSAFLATTKSSVLAGQAEGFGRGSKNPLRERVRSILCDGCANGRLLRSLLKNDRFLIEEAPKATESRYDRLGHARTEAAHSIPEVKKEPEPFVPKKKKAKGLEAALKLAVAQHAAPEDAKTPHSPTSPSSPSKAAAKHAAEAAKDAQHKADEEQRALQHDKQRRKKFAEAERQAEKKRVALELHEMRTAYIQGKLKPLLDHIVGGVSSDSERPPNPVPLMIELLSEVAGKHPSYYSDSSPAKRLAREVMELQKDCADLQDKIDRNSEYETEDEDEDVFANCKEASRPNSRGSVQDVRPTSRESDTSGLHRRVSAPPNMQPPS